MRISQHIPRRTTHKAEKVSKNKRHEPVIETTPTTPLKMLQPLKPATRNHERYLQSLQENVVTICLGPAGTGKSFMAVGHGASQLVAGRIDRILMTRPMIQCSDVDEIGFLPGDLTTKIDPFLLPLTEPLEQFLGREHVEQLAKAGAIEIFPVSLMRGRSFKNTLLIIDEAQNCTMKQLRMLLTRIDKGTTVVVCGDAKQSDLAPGENKFEKVVFLLSTVKGVGVVRLHKEDNMREPIIVDIDAKFDLLLP
jgi:phosphate starvation-inducible protein PhoH and related proteins